MAMDTAGERYSAINIGSPWRGLNYLPTGTVDTQERQAVAYLYAGIASGLSAPVLLGTVPNLRERKDTGTHQLDVGSYFSGAASYSIAPAVEAGWSFDTNTGVLTIDTDVVGTFGPYTVTATNVGGNTDSNAFSVEVYEVLSQGGSAKRKQRKRHLVEIDGQFFEVADQSEAIALLERAHAAAQSIAEQAVERSVKRIRRGKKAVAQEPPVIQTDAPEIQAVVDEYRARIDAVYRQIPVDAEIRELMRLKLLDEDDEEAVFVLLH